MYMYHKIEYSPVPRLVWEQYVYPLSRLQGCNKSHTIPSILYYSVGKGLPGYTNSMRIVVFYAIYRQLSLVPIIIHSASCYTYYMYIIIRIHILDVPVAEVSPCKGWTLIRWR